VNATGQKVYNRRSFLKVAGTIVITFFTLLWVQLINTHLNLHGRKGFQKVSLRGKPDGIYFFDEFLISKKGAALYIMSNKCTHAGCRVNKEQQGNIVCACHGSAYKATGEVIKGPAVKSLQKLSYSIDPVSGEITVKL